MSVFILDALLRLNSSQYDKGLDDAEKKGRNFGDKLKTGLGTAVSTIGKLSVAAVGAAATGLTVITKQAIDAYGTFQQLEGGTALLFGDAYDFVMNKSQEAYKNVQMSQNDYLQQVNGFATGLKVALGGNEQAAAELADRIITGEADIVAATGASQEAVQNAFNGIMKSNFTMIDNLQLGINPTKEGFQQMIDSVNEYNAAHGKMTEYTIDNLADCQNALLDYVEMQGLSGYAQNEAAGTIQGSLAMVKGAWSDLLAGLANPDADLGKLMTNLVKSASAAFHNLVPAISQTVKSIGLALRELAPVISSEVIPLIQEILPQLIETATILVDGLIEALPAIIESIIPVLPELLNTVINSIITILPMLLDVCIQAVGILGNGLLQNIDLLINSAIQLIVQMATALSEPSNLTSLLNASVKIMKALMNGLRENAPMILSAVATIMGNILTGIGNALPNIADFLLTNVSAIFQTLWADIGTILNGISTVFNTVFEGIKNTIKNAVKFIVSLFKGDFAGAFGALGSVVGGLLDTVESVFGNILNVGKDLVNNLLNAFKFKWELPKIKLPHISVSGGTPPYGIAGQGSLPKFDIKWYKKAYDDAYIMNGPTIFGAQGGKLLAGGEGNGSETIVGTELLMNMVGTVVRDELENLVLPVYLDGDKIVGYIAPRIDTELGRLTNMSTKGAY